MISASLYFLQERLIFLPTSLPQEYNYSFEHDFEEVFLTAPDGARINALHFKANDPSGLVLYFHGNAGNLARWGEITGLFVEQNYDVFVMDYRTYGKSTGKLSEDALYRDAQMCYDHVAKFYNAQDINIYGRSLGTGMATFVASKNKARQLILETPYYSLPDVAKNRFPLFPVKQLMSYRFPSYKYVQDIDCPITIFHGTNDQVISHSSGERLFKSIPSDKKVFISVKDGGHNDLINFDSYRKVIRQILH
jgi:fermentation-respiration switch protein FrsA (DUF1100 family)